jgi:WD40 repeat protein
VRNLAFNHDGTLVASASSDNQQGAVWVWEVATGREQHVLPGHHVVDFHPTQNLVASAAADGMVHIWDLAKREEWLELQGHRGLVTSLAFNTDGSVLASGSSVNFGIFLWNTESEAKSGQIATLYAHTSSVWDLAFMPGEGHKVMLASASFDGSVRLWGVPEEE